MSEPLPRCKSCVASGQRATECAACENWDRIFAQGPPGDNTFQPQFFEHLGPTGAFVSSRRELKEKSDQHGLISHYLEY